MTLRQAPCCPLDWGGHRTKRGAVDAPTLLHSSVELIRVRAFRYAPSGGGYGRRLSGLDNGVRRTLPSARFLRVLTEAAALGRPWGVVAGFPSRV